jgi:hypothetical protein
MADPDDRGHVVRDAWNAAVDELMPNPKLSWRRRWADLNPGDRHDAFQIEADRRIYDAVAAAEHAKSGALEWLCPRCSRIHSHSLDDGPFTMPCPSCDALMVPTSPAIRRIERLEAQLRDARSAYSQVLADLAALRSATASRAADLAAAQGGLSQIEQALERLGDCDEATTIMNNVSTFETDWWASHSA